jgi:hypothetical protein
MAKGGKVTGVNQAPQRARSQEQQVKDLLKDPSLFPDEFKAWLPRWLYNNVNFTITSQQLPRIENPHVVGATGEVAFQNAWVNFGGSNATCSYYKDAFGRVWLKGTVKTGTIGNTIFTLPSGYRPAEAELFAVASNGAFGIATVNPDGTVVASAGSNVYFTLSGISFRQFA